MARVLLIEDQSSDIRQALQILQELELNDVIIRTGALEAMEALRGIERGQQPLPNLVILDLQLGYESGFEILRYWKASPTLCVVPIVVWTGIGGKVEEDICHHFGVSNFIRKEAGPTALKQALRTATA